MSVPTLDPAEGASGGLLGPVNSVMATIFDTVETPEPGATPTPGEPTEPPAGEEPPAAGEGTEPPAAGATPDEPAAGAEAEPTPAASEVRSAPPVVTADDKVIVEEIGTLSEALDTRFTESFEQQAIEEAQEEYPQYISMLQLHPLELVGKPLPPIDGTDDDIVLRTAQEVADWQEAVKTILQRDIQASVQQKQLESSDVLDVIHASIEMFRDNPDLVPGSPSYNKELASAFVKIAEPYALKMNGKLTGYSIPVQGLINQVRAQHAASKAAPAAVAPPAKKGGAPAAAPQAGIPSKAGASGGDGEDFAAMWKALGVDNVPI